MSCRSCRSWSEIDIELIYVEVERDLELGRVDNLAVFADGDVILAGRNTDTEEFPFLVGLKVVLAAGLGILQLHSQTGHSAIRVFDRSFYSGGLRQRTNCAKQHEKESNSACFESHKFLRTHR